MLVALVSFDVLDIDFASGKVAFRQVYRPLEGDQAPVDCRYAGVAAGASVVLGSSRRLAQARATFTRLGLDPDAKSAPAELGLTARSEVQREGEDGIFEVQRLEVLRAGEVLYTRTYRYQTSMASSGRVELGRAWAGEGWVLVEERTRYESGGAVSLLESPGFGPMIPQGSRSP
jgi:hypothetical protein